MNNISIKTGNLFDEDFRQNEIYRLEIDNRLKLELLRLVEKGKKVKENLLLGCLPQNFKMRCVVLSGMT